MPNLPSSPSSQPADTAPCDPYKASCPCITYRLYQPFLIALAQEPGIREVVDLKVKDDILQGGILKLGQDAKHGTGMSIPGFWKTSVSDDENKLRACMPRLLDYFATEDPDGKAKRIVDRFLQKNSQIEEFTDDGLNTAISKNENFLSNSNRIMQKIYLSLRENDWDINKVNGITGGAPAFNLGHLWPKITGDHANGLFLMMDAVQYVYVYVEYYYYNSCEAQHRIRLKFVLYDVFGLDDDDLATYGQSVFSQLGLGPLSSISPQAAITAWWQLQHQFNYAPLLIRAIVYRDFNFNLFIWW